MKLLLDTHIFLFFINGSLSISEHTLSLINSKNTEKLISIVSIWVIIIKINISKLKLRDDINAIYALLKLNGIIVLQIYKLHFETYLSIPLIHKDPFDRLIISQAIAEDLTLVTDDQHIRNYPGLKLL